MDPLQELLERIDARIDALADDDSTLTPDEYEKLRRFKPSDVKGFRRRSTT